MRRKPEVKRFRNRRGSIRQFPVKKESRKAWNAPEYRMASSDPLRRKLAKADKSAATDEFFSRVDNILKEHPDWAFSKVEGAAIEEIRQEMKKRGLKRYRDRM